VLVGPPQELSQVRGVINRSPIAVALAMRKGMG
jgi:hypothetical protein